MGRGLGILRRPVDWRLRLPLGLTAIAMIGAALWQGYWHWIDPIGASLRELSSGTVAGRIDAAATLAHDGASRRDEAIPPLVRALRDDDPGVRAASITALYALIPFLDWNPPSAPIPKIDPPARRAVLLALIDVVERDRDIEVRRAAARLITLFPCESADLPALLARFRDRAEDPEVRAWLLNAACQADRASLRESLDAALSALGDPAPRVRSEGYMALGLGLSAFPIAEPELIDAVRRGLEDPDSGVRLSASRVIPIQRPGELLAPWRPLIPQLFDASGRASVAQDRRLLLRTLAALARGTEHSPRVLAEIIAELRAPAEDSAHWNSLARVLRDLGADAIPALPALAEIRSRFREQPGARSRLSITRDLDELIDWLSALSIILHRPELRAR